MLRYPNDAMAQLAGVSTEEYEDFYFRACLVDYDKMGRAMRHLEKLMDRTDRVHIIAPGTDLTFSIQGIPCYAMHGNRNIPDGEVYTSPVRDSVNGHITYNCPSPYDGFLFRDVYLEFRAPSSISRISFIYGVLLRSAKSSTNFEAHTPIFRTQKLDF